MKVRVDFVTNSSSSSFVFVGKDIDSILENIERKKIFGKAFNDFNTQIEQIGFNRVLSKDDILDYLGDEYFSNWLYYQGNKYTETSRDLVEFVINREYLDNNLIVKVKINYQGDGVDPHCLYDASEKQIMVNIGERKLRGGIFSKDFSAFLCWAPVLWSSLSFDWKRPTRQEFLKFRAEMEEKWKKIEKKKWRLR